MQGIGQFVLAIRKLTHCLVANTKEFMWFLRENLKHRFLLECELNAQLEESQKSKPKQSYREAKCEVEI